MSKATIGTKIAKGAARTEGPNPSLLRLFSRFGELSDADLRRVARGSECQLIPAGNTIFRQDDDADSVYLLLDGTIRLEHRDDNGRALVQRVFGPFDAFGDDALLGEDNRFYTAQTNSVSVVVRTPLSLVREVLATDPNLAQAWIHAVSVDRERRAVRMDETAAATAMNPAFPDAA